MRCEDFRGRIAALVEETLSDREEAACREHARRCDACRSELVRQDPSRLFAVLAEENKPAAFWNGFWEGLEPNLARRRLPLVLLQRYEPVLAALLVTAIALGAFLAASTVMQKARVTARAVPALTDREGGDAPDLTLAVMRTLEQRYAIANTLATTSPGVEVFDLTYQDEDSSVYRVTMMIDERLEETF